MNRSSRTKTDRQRQLAKLASLRRLAPFLRSRWSDALLAGLCVLLSTSATFAVTFFARSLVDQGLARHTALAIGKEFTVLGAAVVALALFTAGRFYFISRLGERAVADLRIAVYARAIGLDQTWFLTTRVDEILTRLTTDLTIVENMVGSSVAVAVRNLLIVIFGLTILVVIDYRFTGLVALTALLIIAPLLIAGRRVRGLSADAQAHFAGAISYAAETLEAVTTVQAFGRETSVRTRFASVMETAFRASLARVRARAAMTALVMILVAGGVGVVLWRASMATFVERSMSPGALLQFVVVAVLTAGAVSALGEAWGDVQKAAGAMWRVAEILQVRPAIVAPPDPKPLPVPARGEMTMRKVVFAYPGRGAAPALDGFDLAVRAGERVALVGPSGAGKSTVFRLLLRFYDPQSGVVSIDGVDVSAADPAEVRGRMALVAQDAPLFSGTPLENLRFADESATDGSLLAAARAAQADRFVMALPQGFATPLGERAKMLSGGERQRLAIARALSRNAPILLLDEATSSLDAENEALVQQALDEAMGQRTTLVIAHRLSTVMKADRIVVMERGRVVETGAHDDLVAAGGLYARLAHLQFRSSATSA